MLVESPDDKRNLLYRIEDEVLRELRGRVGRLHLEVREGGLVMHGTAYSFYGKQMALHAVRSRSPFPVIGNRVSVLRG